MGNLMAKPQEPEFSSSDVSEEENDISLDSDGTILHSTLSQRPVCITLSDVREMESNLEEYEKVSLIFLLSENNQDCLDNISLYEWGRREMAKNIKWQIKLLEALAIIKNFQIPKQYGFTKPDLILEFHPFYYFTSKYISQYRKILYLVCEQLNEEEQKNFLKYIRKDFIERGLKFNEYSYMEMYFSYFLKVDYISHTNMKNCSKIFKVMGFEDVCDWMNTLYVEGNEPTKVKVSYNNMKEHKLKDEKTNINITDESISQQQSDMDISLAESRFSNSSQDNARISEQHKVHATAYTEMVGDNIFDMTGNRICFIINQENFYTETDEKYKHLLPEIVSKEQLHPRVGTSRDKDTLKKTFKQRRFQVEVARNLTHLKIISELKRVVNQIDEKNCSCLFIFILSHGDEGVVFGCNSCMVEISEIIEIMCHTKLYKVPKVLILQSCQGPVLKKIFRMDDNLEVDGPIKSKPIIQEPEFLLFCSTVPGFSSIRDKHRGTWFIQSLCNQLDKDGDRVHFEDICTNIIREVSNKKVKKDEDTDCFMLPLKETTFSRKLYLKT